MTKDEQIAALIRENGFLKKQIRELHIRYKDNFVKAVKLRNRLESDREGYRAQVSRLESRLSDQPGPCWRCNREHSGFNCW